MLTQDQYQTILIEKSARGVAIATLNRPEKLNAFTVGMMSDLLDLFDRVEVGARVEIDE